MVLFAFLSCVDNGNSVNPPPKSESSRKIAVITTVNDFTSPMNFQIIDVGSADYTVSANNLITGPLHTDLAVRTYGKDIYILERYGKDNIIKYDSKEMAVDYSEPLGLGASINIQDIAVVSQTKAYISCLNSKDLIVFNPNTGKRISAIDLSDYSAGEAPHPYAGALAVYGPYVYVACQRFTTDFYGVQDYGQIVIIDSRTDEVEKVITLERKNPQSMDIFHNRLLVASAGEMDSETFAYVGGGVEMIDLTANQNIGVIADIDGASRVAFVSLTKAYVSAGGFSDFEVFPINPTAKTTGESLGYIGDGMGGIVYDGFKVYVGDMSFTSPGVVVINPATNAFEERIPVASPMMPAGLGVIFGD